MKAFQTVKFQTKEKKVKDRRRGAHRSDCEDIQSLGRMASATPDLRLPLYSFEASPSKQIMLLGDRGICVWWAVCPGTVQ